MSKPEQVSRRHHFVPQFYLSAWNSDDEKGLWLYQRDFKDLVKSYRRPTRSVGYARDLYTLRPETNYSVLNYPEDSIEKDFFAVLDDDAAKVHQKLVHSGLKDLSLEDRYVWALFLNSLIERGPSRITEIEAADSGDTLRNALIEKWGHSKFADKIDFDAMYKNSVRHVLISRIKEKAVVEYFSKMRWAVIHLPIEGEHFITSDKPVVINAGQEENPIHCLSMSISPSKLFIAHSDSSEFDEEFLRTLTMIHNIIIMERAEKYVVSSKKMDDGPHIKYSRAIHEFLAISSDKTP